MKSIVSTKEQQESALLMSRARLSSCLTLGPRGPVFLVHPISTLSLTTIFLSIFSLKDSKLSSSEIVQLHMRGAMRAADLAEDMELQLCSRLSCSVLSSLLKSQ